MLNSRQRSLKEMVMVEQQGLENEAGRADREEVAVMVAHTRTPSAPIIPRVRWFLSPKAHLVMDTTITILLLVIYGTLQAAKPRQVYMIKDTLYKHSYPYKANTVPSWAVPVYSIGTPLVAFVVWKLFPGRRVVTWFDFYKAFLAMLFASFLVGCLTDSTKNAIGRPRPNFVSQCWPSGNIAWEDGTETDYGGVAKCVDPKHVEEFQKSFPSGHSSWSAAGLGFLTYWLLGQTRAFFGSGRAWALMVSLVPAIAALIVGITRITDYWHNVSDVCFGLALGYGIALIVYLQLFPFFTHELCHVPRYALPEAAVRPPVRRLPSVSNGNIGSGGIAPVS